MKHLSAYFFILLCLTGCKRQDPQPELKDPIYSDIFRQTQDANKELESSRKELEGAKKEWEMADPQTGESRVKRATYFDIQNRLNKMAQETRFLELTLQRRKDFVRAAYLKAFEKDQEWPDPNELKYYKANKSLVSAPRSYDETHKMRVQQRAPAQIPKKAAAKQE